VSLKALFSELNNWKDNDNLAIICLRITAILLNRNKESQIIAKELALVLGEYQAIEIEQELYESMVLADNSLDENLRGFSNLLKTVLKDHGLKRNTKYLLRKLDINQNLIKNFDELINRFEAYFDLSDKFFIKTPQAMTVIFLQALADIYMSLGLEHDRAIFQWLNKRVKNYELVKLYLSWQKFNWAGCSHELLLLYICNKFAKKEIVRTEEIFALDFSLKNTFAPRLKSLIDSGFLVLETSGSYRVKTVKKDLYIASGKSYGQSTKS
jgi:hypothetical protein